MRCDQLRLVSIPSSRSYRETRIRSGCLPCAFESKTAMDLILRIQRFVEARFEGILMHGANDRNLIVVTRASAEIGQRIEI